MFKNDIILELITIMEYMAESLRKIIYYEDEYDLNSYNEELNKFNMFLSKEHLLLSRIPKDIDVLNYVLSFISDRSNYEIKNESNYKYVMARLVSSINEIIRSIQTDEYLDESVISNIISNNLTLAYLNSINNVYMISDNLNDNYTFRNIQYYNSFVNRPVFEKFYNNGFSFNNLPVYKDDELSSILNMDIEEYLSFKEDVVASSISSFLDILLRPSSKKNNLVTLDFYLNFKFLLSKVSNENLLYLNEEILSYFEDNDLNKIELGIDVLNALEYEINKRDLMVLQDKTVSSISLDDYDSIIGLIKLESVIYDKFYNNDDLHYLNNLLEYEKEYLSNIDLSNISIDILNNMLNDDLWFFINNNDENKISLIRQRLYTILPIFKDLIVPSSQTNESFLSIYKNYLIKNLRDFYKMIQKIDNDTVKNIFKSIYRDNFFVNSEITDEYVALNGNYSYLTPLSDDIVEMESKVNSLEFNYDKVRQMYNFATKSFDYLLENEYNIETISDFANYEFQIISFINSVNELDYNSVQDLKKYMKRNSSLFSKLRRDLMRIIDISDSSEKKLDIKIN